MHCTRRIVELPSLLFSTYLCIRYLFIIIIIIIINLFWLQMGL
jgi:hypothetical protein